MARLLVLRGDSLDRELELSNRTVRIGRGADSDLVLEDPGKSVSRNHAELRFEGGRYVLVDLQSQNGIWVAGTRVPYVVLEPNVVASVGPFRLMLDSGAPRGAAADDATPFPGMQPISNQTYYGEDAAAASGARSPQAAGAGAKAAAAAADASWFGRQPKWAMAGIIVALLAAAGGIAYGVKVLVAGPAQAPVSSANALFEDVAARLASGDCAGARARLDEALSANPDDPRGPELGAKVDNCAAAPSAPAPPPAAPVRDERLVEAERVIGTANADECARVLRENIAPVLETDPSNADALDLKDKGEKCVATTAPAATTATQLPPEQRIAVAIAPKDGGLEVFKGESQRNYTNRVNGMRARYQDAKDALSKGQYQKADALFRQIMNETPPGYLDVAERASEARSRVHDVAQKSYQAAHDDEDKKDWDRALDEYRRAHDLDPSIAVDADVARVRDQRMTAARTACTEANVRYGFGRNAEAMNLYRDAIKSLPADDPCVAEAIKRFPSLRQ